VAAQKIELQGYAGKVTEGNYIEKVGHLLSSGDNFRSSIHTILKAQKFIKKSFSKVKEFKRFIEDVSAELKKADSTDEIIREAHDEFMRLYKQDMVKNFAQLQQQAQVVKDSYYKLIKNAAAGMTHEYQLLDSKVEGDLRNLKHNYPSDLNVYNLKKLEELKHYCKNRMVKEPALEYSTTCKNCGYSFSDILNYTALAPTKDNELLIIESSFVKEVSKHGPGQESVPKSPRKVKFQIPEKVMTVQDYRSLLKAQLTALSAAQPDEEIELDIEVP
jgi:predicted Zn-ribbon and HTH transcriptional regulator